MLKTYIKKRYHAAFRTILVWIALGIVVLINTPHKQKGAKKIVCDSLGVVDFAIRPANSVLKLLDGQLKFFWAIQISEKWKSILPVKNFFKAS